MLFDWGARTALIVNSNAQASAISTTALVMIFELCFSRIRKSYAACKASQPLASLPKQCFKRKAVSADTPRLPSTISRKHTHSHSLDVVLKQNFARMNGAHSIFINMVSPKNRQCGSSISTSIGPLGCRPLHNSIRGLNFGCSVVQYSCPIKEGPP